MPRVEHSPDHRTLNRSTRSTSFQSLKLLRTITKHLFPCNVNQWQTVTGSTMNCHETVCPRWHQMMYSNRCCRGIPLSNYFCNRGLKNETKYHQPRCALHLVVPKVCFMHLDSFLNSVLSISALHWYSPNSILYAKANTQLGRGYEGGRSGREEDSKDESKV